MGNSGGGNPRGSTQIRDPRDTHEDEQSKRGKIEDAKKQQRINCLRSNPGEFTVFHHPQKPEAQGWAQSNGMSTSLNC